MPHETKKKVRYILKGRIISSGWATADEKHSSRKRRYTSSQEWKFAHVDNKVSIFFFFFSYTKGPMCIRISCQAGIYRSMDRTRVWAAPAPLLISSVSCPCIWTFEEGGPASRAEIASRAGMLRVSEQRETIYICYIAFPQRGNALFMYLRNLYSRERKKARLCAMSRDGRIERWNVNWNRKSECRRY